MISLAHRTVFVHVPKCGGQSVELAFLQHLGLTWKTRRPLLLAKRPKAWAGKSPQLAHLKAQEYIAGGYLPQKLWSELFSFAIVRNPFARVESAFHYLDPKAGSLEEFAVSLAQRRRQGFMDPAWDYVSNTDGEMLVSAWYRLEEIARGWPEITERANLPGVALPHRNSTATKKRTAVWTPAALQAVREVYADDFLRFGYDVGKPPEKSSDRRRSLNAKHVDSQEVIA